MARVVLLAGGAAGAAALLFCLLKEEAPQPSGASTAAGAHSQAPAHKVISKAEVVQILNEIDVSPTKNIGVPQLPGSSGGRPGFKAHVLTVAPAMSVDFTGRWTDQQIEIPDGQHIGDKWTVSGVYGSSMRFFAFNLLAGGSTGDVPLQLVPDVESCLCTRRFQGRWSGSGASGPQRAFDTDYNGGVCPNHSSNGKVKAGGPFLLEVRVEAKGYRCTLRRDAEDADPVVVCYAHRDDVEKTTHVSLVSETWNPHTTVSAFTLNRETIVLTLDLVQTTTGLIAHFTNMGGTEVASMTVEPGTTVQELRAFVEKEMASSATIRLTLGAHLLTPAEEETTVQELLQL